MKIHFYAIFMPWTSTLQACQVTMFGQPAVLRQVFGAGPFRDVALQCLVSRNRVVPRVLLTVLKKPPGDVDVNWFWYILRYVEVVWCCWSDVELVYVDVYYVEFNVYTLCDRTLGINIIKIQTVKHLVSRVCPQTCIVGHKTSQMCHDSRYNHRYQMLRQVTQSPCTLPKCRPRLGLTIFFVEMQNSVPGKTVFREDKYSYHIINMCITNIHLYVHTILQYVKVQDCINKIVQFAVNIKQ